VNPLLRYFKEKEMEAPTLYIMGEVDHMFLPPVQKMVKEFKHSYLEIVEGSGHVVNVDKPDEFNRISLEFLVKQRTALQQSA
jgi:pimeloyl-ACP methyl ester carboxylesterase